MKRRTILNAADLADIAKQVQAQLDDQQACPDCAKCNGTGWRPLAAEALWLPMQAAVAATRIRCECGAEFATSECPDCEGTGTVKGATGVRKSCSRCRGSGEVAL